MNIYLKNVSWDEVETRWKISLIVHGKKSCFFYGSRWQAFSSPMLHTLVVATRRPLHPLSLSTHTLYIHIYIYISKAALGKGEAVEGGETKEGLFLFQRRLASIHPSSRRSRSMRVTRKKGRVVAEALVVLVIYTSRKRVCLCKCMFVRGRSSWCKNVRIYVVLSFWTTASSAPSRG